MAIVRCIDCGNTDGPNNPSAFVNIRPREERREFGGLWVCEDCHGTRDRIAESFHLFRPPR